MIPNYKISGINSRHGSTIVKELLSRGAVFYNNDNDPIVFPFMKYLFVRDGVISWCSLRSTFNAMCTPEYTYNAFSLQPVRTC